MEEGSDLAGVGAAMVSGETVYLTSERHWPLRPLPENVVTGVGRPDGEGGPARIVISDRLAATLGPRRVIYRPPSLVVGVGCSCGAGAEEILKLVGDALDEVGLSRKSVAALSSIDVKADEPGLLEVAKTLDVRVRLRSAEELSCVEVTNPSPVVEGGVCIPDVAEASVLVNDAELLVEKRKSANATAAAGRLPTRGRLVLVAWDQATQSSSRRWPESRSPPLS